MNLGIGQGAQRAQGLDAPLGEDFEQPRVGPGLLHKVAHAELHRFDGQAHRGPSGHGHDRRSVLDFLEPGEKVQAFAAGRGVARIVQVNEENVELLAAHSSQQLRRGIHRFNAIAMPFEQEAQRIKYVLLVIGNENSRLQVFTVP